MSFKRHYLNLIAKDGASWSGKWQRAKRKYYKTHEKKCACCGTKKKIELHHKKPRHSFPELALVEGNFTPLCGGGKGCHFHIGHLNSYYTYNEAIQLVCEFVRRNSIKKKNKVA